MKRDPQIFIEHILDSIEAIKSHVARMDVENFKKDIKTQDAVMRRLEIIGEAVKNLPAPFKKEHPKVSWPKIAGMRNFLIHEYFGVELKLVWTTVKKNLPELKKQLLAIKFPKRTLRYRVK
jgi:uncharacterized protein with HEPN domain